MFETLENRRMFSVTVEAYSDTLFVWGDNNPNGINVEKQGGDLVVKQYNGSNYNEIFRKSDSYVKEIRMYGAGGADTLTVDSAVTDKVLIMGGAGNDFIRGGGGMNELWGHGNFVGSPLHSAESDDAAADILVSGKGYTVAYGQKGNDTLMTDTNANSGYDFLNGGDGNDQFTVGGSGAAAYCIGGKGNDTFKATQNSTQQANFYGNAGYDTVDYTDWTIGVAVYNNGVSPSGARYGAERHQIIQTDIEVIKGTNQDDFFSGHSGVDTYYGYDGDDMMYGYGGDDILIGGDGNDYIYGLDGNDFINGGNGNDHLEGGAGNDNIYGGAGNDLIKGGANNDAIYGEAGSDWIYGDAGNDLLVGGTGADYIVSHDYAFGNDAIFGDNLDGSGGLPGEFDIAYIDKFNGFSDMMFGIESFSW